MAGGSGSVNFFQKTTWYVSPSVSGLRWNFDRVLTACHFHARGVFNDGGVDKAEFGSVPTRLFLEIKRR